MITVLLVDDYPIMRQLLRDILERYADIRIIGEAESGEDAVAQTTTLRPQVVIMDFNLPTMSGTEATTLIRLQSPCTAVIGLTAGAPEDTANAMLKAGAAAVLNKGELLKVLHPIIVQSEAAVKASAFASASVSPN